MIGVLLALSVVSQAASPGSRAPNSAQLISAMLAKYAAARSLTGTITLTQSAMDHAGQLRTTLQFELPSKLYLRQDLATGQGRTWLVTSDGKYFSYDVPKLPWQDRGTRLVEPVVYRGRTQSVREIYAASALSLGDRSAPLDIAIGRNEDLRYLKNQWASLRYQGRTKLRDEDVHVIMGDWREYGDAPASGQFRMMLSESGDLRQYALSENFALPTVGQKNVVSIWDVRLEVDAKPDPNLFKLVR